jgi:hypothetical protein
VFAGNLAFVVSAAVDVVVLCGAVVWGVRGGRPGVALAGAAGVLAAKGLVLLKLGLGVPFGVMHVAWLDLVVVVPLAGLVALALRRGGRPLHAVALTACCLAPVGVYASFVEPERLVLERADVPLAPERAGERALRIGVIERSYWNGAARATVAALERPRGRADVRLLLTHRPDAVKLLSGARVDLTVAGHTHGGQLQLPLVGPLTTASGVPRDVAAGGLHEIDGHRIYVSRGVGVERGQAPRLRMGAVPEVSLITLR